MDYVDMCDRVRALMIEEVERDGADLYGSSWFTDAGVSQWKGVLLNACSCGSDASLAAELRSKSFLVTHYQRKAKSGYSTVAVPYNAHNTIAETNFSRMYLRGVCRYALEQGVTHLTGYRAMYVERPRPGSEEKIGMLFGAAEMLADIRATMSGAPVLGMPPGVGSGILARLP